MLKLESLDPKFKDQEKDIEKLASWLITKLRKSQIETKKQFPKEADFYLELYLVNDKTLAKNVYAYEHPKNFPTPETDATALGEIYINPDIAKSQGYSIEFMLIHGFLHLLGYEHESKNDTIAMETLEKSLLADFGGSVS